MIRVLEKFEDRFPEIEETRDGQVFKSDLRNAFNDVIRAQRDEVRDYQVEYRPLQLTDDNVLAVTQTFMRSVQKIEFGFTDSEAPYVEVHADNPSVLEALRSEMDAGVILHDDDGSVLLIAGTDAVANSVLPIMDRYRLHAGVAPCYREWREQVVRFYRR